MNSNDIQQAYNSLLEKYEKALRKLADADAQASREVVMPISSKAERMYIEKIKHLESQLQTSNTTDINLREAARLLVNSDFNKEDLSEQEIVELLTKLSEDEVNSALGFWAVPLPSEDSDSNNKPRYTSNK